ncbi:Por secretion system C-terminal sorting domain-containing protein [Flexibacter flexilis DSM 6793]|uniref:Por secretion system C-terminal sorting domain-containing protein n=1 Tax=Flexibacter flexilis DSM 6793 TaxID=927664 RepID=A0A1I1FVP5_9BACT|nr:hypothetical protein [Flexibacter flexilis]SFC01708.1 Por secretion system C-terminal sorting domain-containing protein [Flexibacter flexilis DSM 6793]
MKKLILLFLLLCGYVFSYGQGTLVWENTYPLPSSQVIRTATLSPNKRFWVGVSDYAYCLNPTTNTYTRTTEILAFKDSNGDTLWHQNFVNYYQESEGWGIAPAPNGNFWAIVVFEHGASSANNRGLGVFLVDSLGQILEHREFMKGCNYLFGSAVHPMSDGGFVLVGHVQLVLSNCQDVDMMAMRIDGSGNLVWQQIYTMPTNQTLISSGLYPNNRVCISYWDGYYENTRMMFIDVPSGVIMQQKAPVLLADLKAVRTWPLRDGGFIFHGGIDTSSTSSHYLPYIARTDANFNILWSRLDSNAVVGSDYLRAIEARDTSVIMMGSTREPTNIAVTYPFMAKVNLITGQELWRKYLSDSALSATYKLAYKINDLIVTENNDLMVVGAAPRLPYVFAQPGDYYMAKYTGVADFLQPSDYCSDSLQANFTGSWVGDTLQLYNTSNSGMAMQDSVDCQWLIGGSTVSIDTAINMQISPSAHPNGLRVTLVITNFWGCKDTLTAIVTPQGIVGNKPVQKGVFVGEVYPNPASNSVSVNYGLPSACKSAVVRMSEVGTGKVLIEQEMSLTGNMLRLNTAPLAAGMYVLQVYADGAPLGVRKVSVVK